MKDISVASIFTWGIKPVDFRLLYKQEGLFQLNCQSRKFVFDERLRLRDFVYDCDRSNFIEEPSLKLTRLIHFNLTI